MVVVGHVLQLQSSVALRIGFNLARFYGGLVLIFCSKFIPRTS